MRVRADVVLIHAVLGMALFGLGCGERPDELGPYVEKLHEIGKYNAKLVEYRFYLKSDQAAKAAGLEQTIEYLRAEIGAN